MKQFIYRASDIGLSEWPSGTLRLAGIEVTEDPDLADIFTVPGALTQLFPDRDSLYRLPYMEGHESRHVLFDCSDNEPLYSMPCLFIRCNARSWYYDEDPLTISWPWPVEDFLPCLEVPEGGFKFDVSHQAWMSSYTRIDASRSCRENPDLHCDIAEYPDFTGYIYYQPEGVRRRAEFRRSMRESRVMLCPESIPGVFPYRFFESCSAGRVPLLVGSDYVLPWRDSIPYEQFCLFLPSDKAANAGSLIREFIRNTSDEEIVRMGQMGRQYWERWLQRDRWPELMAEAVLKKLGASCAL